MNPSALIHLSFPVLTILFSLELLFLHFLSRRLTQSLYTLFFRIFRNKTISMTILIILLFPGTVVHELAHLFTAEILGVRTGKLTLVPESLEGEEIKAGAVMIAHTDPLRRTLIGLAPFSVGIAALATASYFLLQNINNINLITIIIFYIMFAISNSMFSSQEDMKGVIPFMITVALFAAAGYVAGFRLGLSGAILAGLHPVIETLVRSLGVVLGVNLVTLAATLLLLKL